MTKKTEQSEDVVEQEVVNEPSEKELKYDGVVQKVKDVLAAIDPAGKRVPRSGSPGYMIDVLDILWSIVDESE